MKNKALIEEIAREIADFGGDAYYVGGYVRDYLLGRESKDIDIEVYNLMEPVLHDILSNFGEVNEVGKSFGVLRIKGLNVDFSMPRKEYSTGEGHKDFDVDVNPWFSIETATRRRDFTINAILMNVLTEEIIDPFNGIKDLRDGIIRYVNETTFVEDPLRVYRAAQFAARFNFTIDCQTLKLMKTIDTYSIPYERIYEEMKKALLMGKRPSNFFEILKSVGHEFINFSCEDTEFENIMHRLNKAASLRDDLPKKDRFLFMCAALDNPGGMGRFSNKSINKITFLNDTVIAIVRDIKMQLKDLNTPNINYLIYRQFIKFKDPTLVYYLARLYVEFDGDVLLAHIYNEYKKRLLFQPRLTGLDLINAGIPSGKHIGMLLEYANNLWCYGDTYEQVKQETLEYARELEL